MLHASSGIKTLFHHLSPLFHFPSSPTLWNLNHTPPFRSLKDSLGLDNEAASSLQEWPQQLVQQQHPFAPSPRCDLSVAEFPLSGDDNNLLSLDSATAFDVPFSFPEVYPCPLPLDVDFSIPYTWDAPIDFELPLQPPTATTATALVTIPSATTNSNATDSLATWLDFSASPMHGDHLQLIDPYLPRTSHDSGLALVDAHLAITPASLSSSYGVPQDGQSSTGAGGSGVHSSPEIDPRSYSPNPGLTVPIRGLSLSGKGRRGRPPVQGRSVHPLDHDTLVKRHRNNMAAKKYRQKKVDRIQELEEEVDQVRQERDELRIQLARQEAETAALREMLKMAASGMMGPA